MNQVGNGNGGCKGMMKIKTEMNSNYENNREMGDNKRNWEWRKHLSRYIHINDQKRNNNIKKKRGTKNEEMEYINEYKGIGTEMKW